MGTGRTAASATDRRDRPPAQRPSPHARRHAVDFADRHPWRDLPERFGPHQTVYDHFRNWRKDGTYDRILQALHVRLDREGKLDWSLWCIDGSSVRASRAAAGAAKKAFKAHPREPADHALGRSRGGFGSKIHLVVDGNGLPLSVEATAGQASESTQVEKVVEPIRIPQRLGRPRARPLRLAGDKGYSCRRVRKWLASLGVKVVIPHKDNERARHDDRVKFDKTTYRRRSIIENCIGWLKECRRIATRYEKPAVSYLAMLKLAMIQRCLRVLFSDRA